MIYIYGKDAVHKTTVSRLFIMQVNVRFRDGALVEDLEHSGFKIQGMPEVQIPTLATVANKDVSDHSL